DLVKAHPHLTEAEVREALLERVDHAQPRRRDRRAVGKTRRETSELRLVPQGQPEPAGKRPDLGLAKPCLDERLARAALASGLQTGAVIAEIVEVGAKEDIAEAEPRKQRLTEIKELRLAVIAAVDGVLGEAGARELVRGDRLIADRERAREV